LKNSERGKIETADNMDKEGIMRFCLKTLLLLFVAFWSSLVVFGGWGIVVFAIVVIAAIDIYRKKTVATFVCHASLPVFCGFVVTLLLANIASNPNAMSRINCCQCLRQIAVAIRAYSAENGSFPPAYIADKNGQPMHSWRVLILPYLGHQSLYKKYNFNEPWDGPNNKRLLAERPSVFVCPSRCNAENFDAVSTNYVAVVGKNAAWRPDQPVDFSDPALKNHRDDTVMLIEDATGIAWTEPRDCSLDAIEAAVSAGKVESVRAPHLYVNSDYFHRPTAYGASVAYLDGHCTFWPSGNLVSDKLKELLAIGGGKEDNVVERFTNETPVIYWPHCVMFAVAMVCWLASVALLWRRAFRSRRNATTDTTDGTDEEPGKNTA
jgi:hypothetical protein